MPASTQIKRCNTCGVEKSLEDFTRVGTRVGSPLKTRPSHECRVCSRARLRRHYKANRDKVREKQKVTTEAQRRKKREIHLRRYGLSLDEYAELLEAQNGVCAICGRVEEDSSLRVDHDHATGKIRGLLCKFCNLSLGNMGDDPDRLLAAAFYLLRHAR